MDDVTTLLQTAACTARLLTRLEKLLTADLWRTPQARLSFMIKAAYGTLPSPQDLYLWYGTEATCQLCSSSNPS